MFSKLAGSLLKTRLSSSPTLKATIDEAASQYMGKAAKIDTAIDGIFAADLKELAAADRQRVAEYSAATVPGVTNGQKPKGAKMGGDFIVCDDYRKGTGTVPAVIMGAVAIASLTIGGLGLRSAMQTEQPVPPAAAVAPAAVDADTHYILELVPNE